MDPVYPDPVDPDPDSNPDPQHCKKDKNNTFIFSRKTELYYSVGQSAGSRKLKFPLNTTSPRVELKWKLYSGSTNSNFREPFFSYLNF